MTSPMNNFDHEGPWTEGEYCRNCPDVKKLLKIHGTDDELVMCDRYSSTHYGHVLDIDHFPCSHRIKELEEEWNRAVDAGEFTPQSKG